MLLSPLYLLTCAKEKPAVHTGGPVSFVVEYSEKNENLVYKWQIIDQPDESFLSVGQFVMNDGGSKVTFIPDKPGHYKLEAQVLQFGDELALKTFDFDAIQSSSAQSPPTNISKEPKWYIEENEKQSTENMSIEKSANAPEKEAVPMVENVKDVVKEQPSKATSTLSANKLQLKNRGNQIPKNEGRFTIQVTSKKSLQDAELFASALIDDGFDAYIQKAYFKETDEVWFRVRVGSYNSREMAQEVAKNINKSHQIDTWVDFVRIED